MIYGLQLMNEKKTGDTNTQSSRQDRWQLQPGLVRVLGHNAIQRYGTERKDNMINPKWARKISYTFLNKTSEKLFPNCKFFSNRRIRKAIIYIRGIEKMWLWVEIAKMKIAKAENSQIKYIENNKNIWLFSVWLFHIATVINHWKTK